jgi:hypothetical protein
MSKLKYVLTAKWVDLRFMATSAIILTALHTFVIAGKVGGGWGPCSRSTSAPHGGCGLLCACGATCLAGCDPQATRAPIFFCGQIVRIYHC